ncbi:MAG: 3-hydroxyacyl-CoA dehydrogenase family protein [Peptococcaceae bacterium]|nr:3-hydroxyacyl-CoA dehydrogenase family protein [Peptococcaceae bacterium]MBQ3508829.1 3-hydroxyacyl-CoA dehydrogenase family protein [Peptococcaceae bacterium]
MKAAVIGAGVMGPGIAQVFLEGGFDAVLMDISEEQLKKGVDMIELVLTQKYEKKIIAEKPEYYLKNLKTTTDMKEAVSDADVVIEAVPEKIDLKKQIYDQLDEYCKPDALIASNTSSLPLPEIFPDFRKGNFCVAHFYNPPPILPLVEIVKNDDADMEKITWLRKVLEDCGKTVIVLNKFIEGFVINRLQTASAREALYLVNEGVISAEDMNLATPASIGFKSVWQGSFQTMDFIGLDTVAHVYNLLYPKLCNDTEVPACVTDKVKEGKLGLKTGEGFAKYTPEEAQATSEQRIDRLLDQLKLWNKHYHGIEVE